MSRKTILVVDDVKANRDALIQILEKDFDILQADDGVGAVDVLSMKCDVIAAVLLDIVMPAKDGIAVLENMKENGWLKHIPVIIISTDSKLENEKKALRLGAVDMIPKPFDSEIVSRRVKNIVELYERKKGIAATALAEAEEAAKKGEKLEKQVGKLEDINRQVMEVLCSIAEFRNVETFEHVQRIKGFTKILAEQMSVRFPEYSLDEKKIATIVEASALHDVGKICISDTIMNKPARLTPDEYDTMKSHTTKGCEIVDTVAEFHDDDFKRYSMEICRYHHERYDGKGYPEGLKGDNIPIAAQLVSLADVYDALVSERVYKAAYSPDKAFSMIQEGECGAFSPKLLESFSLCRAEMEKRAAEDGAAGDE